MQVVGPLVLFLLLVILTGGLLLALLAGALIAALLKWGVNLGLKALLKFLTRLLFRKKN